MAARLVPRGRWSTGLSWGTKVLVPPDGVWRLRCSPLEMRKLRLRGSFWWGGGTPRSCRQGRGLGQRGSSGVPRWEPAKAERQARGWPEGAETGWAGLRRHRPRLPARSARLPSLRGRGGRGEPAATTRAPRRARPAPGSMGPPLCAARPALRRARSLPRGQVRALWVLRGGDAGRQAGGILELLGPEETGGRTPVCGGGG